MPAVSQKQEKFMNFVHAVQKGEASAKGYPQVKQTAKTMKPSSVEHFMGRGHIDKNLPKQVKKGHIMTNVTAYQRGFIKAALEAGLSEGEAVDLLKASQTKPVEKIAKAIEKPAKSPAAIFSKISK